MRISTLTAAALAALLLTPLLAVSPAIARMNDDDLYCYEVDTPSGPDIQCEPFGTLRAECKLSDPDNTTEMCRDVNSMQVSPLGFTARGESGPPATFVPPGGRAR